MPRIRIEMGNQITLPQGILEQLKLKEGESLEIQVEDDVIVLVPEKNIPKNQKWFWTDKWQKMYREALEAVKEGRVKVFDHVEDLIEELHS